MDAGAQDSESAPDFKISNSHKASLSANALGGEAQTF
jgi:hypothetical protein